MTVLEALWGLSSVNEGERRKAALHLCSLVAGEDGLDEEQEGFEDASYALRRLVRGLGSGNKAARQGFATALSALLRDRKNDRLFAAENVFRLVKQLCNESEEDLTKAEVRDRMIGRVFGFMTIVRANVPGISIEMRCEMATEIMAFPKEKKWFSELCGEVLCDIVETCDDSSLPQLANLLAPRNEENLSSLDLHRVAVLVVLEKAARKLPSVAQIVRGPTRLSWETNRNFLMDLGKCMRGACAFPRMHSLWPRMTDLVWQDGAINIETFWNTTVIEGLVGNNAAGSTLERKFCVMQVFQYLAYLSVEQQQPDASLMMLQNGKFVKMLSKDAKRKASPLRKHAMDTVKFLDEQLARSSVPTTLRLIAAETIAAEGLSLKCAQMNLSHEQGHLEDIPKLLDHFDECVKSEKPVAVVTNVILSLFRSMSVAKRSEQDELAIQLLSFFHKFVVEGCEDPATIQACMKSVNSITQHLAKQHLVLLRKSWKSSSPTDGMLGLAKNNVTNRLVRSIAEAKESGDTPADYSVRLTKELEKKRNQTGLRLSILACRTLLDHLELLRIFNMTQVVENFDAIFEGCIETARGLVGIDIESEDQDPAATLVDIMIGLLSNESAETKHVVRLSFALLCPALDTLSMVLIFDVLCEDFNKEDVEMGEEQEEGEEESDDEEQQKDADRSESEEDDLVMTEDKKSASNSDGSSDLEAQALENFVNAQIEHRGSAKREQKERIERGKRQARMKLRVLHLLELFVDICPQSELLLLFPIGLCGASLRGLSLKGAEKNSANRRISDKLGVDLWEQGMLLLSKIRTKKVKNSDENGNWLQDLTLDTEFGTLFTKLEFNAKDELSPIKVKNRASLIIASQRSIATCVVSTKESKTRSVCSLALEALLRLAIFDEEAKEFPFEAFEEHMLPLAQAFLIEKRLRKFAFFKNFVPFGNLKVILAINQCVRKCEVPIEQEVGRLELLELLFKRLKSDPETYSKEESFHVAQCLSEFLSTMNSDDSRRDVQQARLSGILKFAGRLGKFLKEQGQEDEARSICNALKELVSGEIKLSLRNVIQNVLLQSFDVKVSKKRTRSEEGETEEIQVNGHKQPSGGREGGDEKQETKRKKKKKDRSKFE